MTNLERIKNMTAEELGGFLAELEWQVRVNDFASFYNGEEELDSMLTKKNEEGEPKTFTYWLKHEYVGGN